MISVGQNNHSDPTNNMAAEHTDSRSAPHGVQGAPNEAALLALMERTGYSMIQENGQRKYGGPPPGWDVNIPTPRGCEVFVGKIPRDCYEDELVPVFEKIGNIYELRLMMDFSGANRGYCFVTYTKRDEAKRAVKELNNFQIRKGRYLGVCLSVDNCRLFVGGIPKNKTKEEIMVEMKKVTEGVVDVIVYPSATDKSKNRGFAFVEYESHRAAAMARRKLIPGRIQLWGHTIAVDWAEPEQEVDEDVMSKVKILYVRNLMLSTTEETLEQIFNQAVQKENAVERVKKLRDYAFVHYREREDALRAMTALNGTNLEGTMVEVSLAKPVDKSEYGMTPGSTVPVQQTFPYPGLDAAAPYLGLPGYYPAALGAAVSAAATAGASKSLASRAPMAVRGAARGGRGRGAAGSRGAGGVQRTYVPPHMRGHRKLATDERLYDILPGMELTPTNPFTLKPHSVKSASQVSIPGLAGHFPTTTFQPNKLCRSVEEAKNYAAEYVLMQLGVPMEVSSATASDPTLQLQQVPSPALTATSVSSATSPVPTSTASLYQGRPLAPTVPYTLTNGSAAAAAAAAAALQQQTDLSTCYGSLPLATNQVPTTTYTLVNPHQGKIATAPQAQLAQTMYISKDPSHDSYSRNGYPAFSPIGFQQY